MTCTLTPERIERVAKYLYEYYNVMSALCEFENLTETVKNLWRDDAVSVLCEAMKP